MLKHRRFPQIVGVIAATFAVGGTLAVAGQKTAKIDPKSTPQLTQAFAIAHAVSAIDQEAEAFPERLRVECERRDRRRFHCDASWREIGDQTTGDRWNVSGRMTVWLMRHQDGITRWHYTGRFTSVDKTGAEMGRYVW